jgi:lipoprotein signal peptidase
MQRFWQRHKTVLVFLIPWGIYLALEAMRGRLANPSALSSGLLVLTFFLLLGIVFSVAAQKSGQLIPSLLGLFAAAIGLTGLDQANKTLVNAILPEGGQIPLLHSWISLGHQRNQANSWLLDLLEINDLNKAWLIAFSLVMLGLIYFMYHFYITQKRAGIFPVAAFVLLSAGVCSALIDQAIWHFTLDYIACPVW